MRVERHDPVDRHEQDRDRVDDQPAAAQALHLQRLAVLTLPLLLERPLREQEGQRRPHGEIDRRAQEEERDVQVGRLVLQDGVLRHRVGVRPEIQLVHAEGDWQEQQGHERQRPACRLQHPADHDAPRAAREVVHHRECQGPERDADPEDVRQQVRLEEVLAVGREADGAERDACEADEHREPLQTGNTGRGGVGRLNHVGSCRPGGAAAGRPVIRLCRSSLGPALRASRCVQWTPPCAPPESPTAGAVAGAAAR